MNSTPFEMHRFLVGTELFQYLLHVLCLSFFYPLLLLFFGKVAFSLMKRKLEN